VNIHWGNVTEDNSFGTHEFMDLCELLDCEPYICGNLGSGTVQEMAEWIEYMTSPAISPMTDLRKKNGREKPWQVKFWGLGNEAWGCGGRMDVHHYVDVAANYAAFCRNYPGNELYKIACGGYGWNDNYNWSEVLMKDGASHIGFQAHAIHYYTSSGQKKQRYSATEFNEAGWFDVLQGTLKIKEILKQNVAIMDRYDPEKKTDLILDEWGTWYTVEEGTNPGFLYQQNSLRDAIVAALNLNIFNNFCERLLMTNIAQTVNVLQAMILTRDTEMIRTPTYYVYKLFVPHHDATLLPTQLKCTDYEFGIDKIPALNASASLDKNGKIHISVVNVNPLKMQTLECMIYGKKISEVTGKVLTAEAINAYNDFGKAEEVSIQEFNGARIFKDVIEIEVPSKSVVMLELH
jgi:alpha-N-arabinofuranosidase